LEIGGVKQNGAVTFEATLEAGISWLLKDESGNTVDTCTKTAIHGVTTTPFTAEEIDATITKAEISSCTHTTTVLKNGRWYFKWDGGTNATITSSETELTVQSTIFGISAVCKTGAGTPIGTLTGVSSGHATIHINEGLVSCGILGNAKWTASLSVTTPTGLGVVQ
jgi:hypothetical protein